MEKLCTLALLLMWLPLLPGRAGATQPTFESGQLKFQATAPGECAVISSPQASGHITIPTSVTAAGTTYKVTAVSTGAFKNNTSITSLLVPAGIDTVATEAFNGCSALTLVEISAAKVIGSMAFRSCSSLTDVRMGAGSITAGDYLFFDCPSLVTVTLPQGWTSVPKGCFSGCRSLESVEFSGSITNIADEAFNNCTSLVAVTLPESTRTLGRKAFYGCTELRRVWLGASTTQIGTQAFDGCKAIDNVICRAATPPRAMMYAFDATVPPQATLTVPTGRKQAYRAESPWRDFAATVEDDNPGMEINLTIVLPAGKVTSREKQGASVPLTLAPEDGWKLTSATLNGREVIEEVSENGVLTLPSLQSDAELVVVFQSLAGITDTENDSPLHVWVKGNTVHIGNLPQGEMVEIFSETGVKLYSGHGSQITLSHNGVAIVKAVGKIFKFRIG
ncbi:MAG: leucine-rich repeat domain-containing protein [Bacteroides sp.]|nr:leucine-rich repeat domain-containing protein [Bacteroides sp.]MCM1477468.1 leucine-rich repeat domain-containing protein [Bacteroides sp.]